MTVPNDYGEGRESQKEDVENGSSPRNGCGNDRFIVRGTSSLKGTEVCNSVAKAAENGLALTGTLQVLLCFLFSFLMRCRHPSVCAPLLGGIFFVVFCEVTGVLFGRYRTRYIFAPVS